jgi:hypothetical protein
MNRQMHRCALRFERTSSSAFRDYTYGAAIEKPLPPLWKRVWIAVRDWL